MGSMKANEQEKPRATTWIPVTTMEEMPLLNEEERAELIASLKEAEAEIAAGNYVVLESSMFANDMLALRTMARPAKE
jgi:hypothetical protein